MKKNLIFYLMCFLIYGIYSCSVNSNRTSYLNPAFENIRHQSEKITIDATQGGVYTFSSGTSIHVPQNAFVSKSGKPIEGNVDIEIQEFHNAIDIMIAGIPMTYDTGGVKQNFITAGMFEINGYYNNEKIDIAQNKNIDIHFATQTIDSSFSFYLFDTITNSWIYQSQAQEVRKHNTYDSLQNTLGAIPIKPIIPRKMTKNIKLLDFDVDYSKYPELAEFHGLMWTFSGKDESMNPDKNLWIYKKNWLSMNLTRISADSDEFNVTLRAQDIVFSTIISPVISDNNYEDNIAKIKSKIDAYTIKQKEYNEKKQLIESQKAFVRSAQINNFGLYNFDKIYNSELITINASFKIDGVEIDNSNINIYLLCSENRAIFTYHGTKNINFRFGLKEKNTLIAVLANNKIAKLSNKDFEKLDLNKETTEFVFDLRTIPFKPNNSDDIQKIIMQL